MDEEQYRRKYEDTHTELGIDALLSKNGSLINESVSKKELRAVRNLNQETAIATKKKHAEDLRLMLHDAVLVRKKELLDKEDLPMYQLLNTLAKLQPKQIEGDVTHKFTFGDMVKKITIESMDTVDVNSKPEEDITTLPTESD